jgi:hypothetical protein
VRDVSNQDEVKSVEMKPLGNKDGSSCPVVESRDSTSRKSCVVDLVKAVEDGNKDMVQFLVENKKIAKELRDKAVLAAVGKDNLDMVKTLLGKNISAEITRRSRGPAFLLALRKEDVELAKSLLNNFSGIIYPYQRAEALKEALESRNNELVNLLLAKNEIYDHAVNNVLSHTTNVKPNLSKSGIIESITL